MPAIDVTSLLSDPDFYSTFTVVSTRSVEGPGGTPVNTPASPVTAGGVVIPDRNMVHRAADGSRFAAAIEIWTRYPLTNGWKTDDTTSQLADIVTWDGRAYTVAGVGDYRDFGAGWFYVSADLLPLVPTVA